MLMARDKTFVEEMLPRRGLVTNSMKLTLKKLFRWDRKSEVEKAAIFSRYEFFRYRLFYLIS